MKSPKSFILILVLAMALVGLSIKALRRSPITVFVLGGADNNVEAYKLNLFFNDEDSTLEALSMDLSEKKAAGDILKSKDSKALEAFSKAYGRYSFVVGLPVLEEGWPEYLGGGVRGLFQSNSSEMFDNLQWIDRIYLAMNTKTPPPPSFRKTESSMNTPVTTTAVLIFSTPTVVPSSSVLPTPVRAVRVEILNGCGITNAADWVARRLKGPGVVIVDTDNADNFHYQKTIVKTAVGSPIALEEALERLGIAKESIEETSNPPGGVDVVVIVGKDFRKLKGKMRERTHY